MKQTLTTSQKIAKIINEAFAPPFSPKGLVKARAIDELPIINLRIGARDVTFTLDGEWFGQGTRLESNWSDLAAKEESVQL